MKKIALVLPEAGPVPAVKGGAIEELLTILVEQNEIEHRVQFMVFCADNEQARAIAEKYKYSKNYISSKDNIGRSSDQSCDTLQ